MRAAATTGTQAPGPVPAGGSGEAEDPVRAPSAAGPAGPAADTDEDGRADNVRYAAAGSRAHEVKHAGADTPPHSARHATADAKAHSINGARADTEAHNVDDTRYGGLGGNGRHEVVHIRGHVTRAPTQGAVAQALTASPDTTGTMSGAPSLMASAS